MRRGDLVTVSLPGAYGKPRPALIIQSDLFAEHPSLTLLPITSHRVESPLFRISLAADGTTGLEKPSQVMVDKATTVPRERIGTVIGRSSAETLLEIERSLTVFLGIAG